MTIQVKMPLDMAIRVHICKFLQPEKGLNFKILPEGTIIETLLQEKFVTS